MIRQSRYYSLIPIEQTDILAGILNNYMDALYSPDIMSRPVGAMSDYFSSQTENVEFRLSCARMSHQLIKLCDSLHSLYNHTNQAKDLVKQYINEYNCDYMKYAQANRVNMINKYGPDDDGPDLTDDWQYLKGYSFVSDLRQHFEHEDRPNDELIGSSSKKDFEPFSILVKNATSLSPFKALQESSGKEIQLHKFNESGERVPMSTADRIEQEINEDINNERVVHLFETFLDHGQQMAEFVQGIEDQKDNKVEAQRLLGMLYHFVSE